MANVESRQFPHPFSLTLAWRNHYQQRLQMEFDNTQINLKRDSIGA
ncbi:MAG: hypothetical protein KDB11_33755 [Planctomycetales bacterium]|nr:hypothetical protein [Planctomycetales bacterium]